MVNLVHYGADTEELWVIRDTISINDLQESSSEEFPDLELDISGYFQESMSESEDDQIVPETELKKIKLLRKGANRAWSDYSGNASNKKNTTGKKKNKTSHVQRKKVTTHDAEQKERIFTLCRGSRLYQISQSMENYTQSNPGETRHV